MGWRPEVYETDSALILMDRKYIDDHHIVARYLAEQLPDAEREAFEAYYLEHPDVVQEMEAAARFKAGLAQLRDSGELTALLKPTSWYQQPRSLGIAASVTIVLIGGYFLFGRGPASQPLMVASATRLVDRLGDPLPVISTHDIYRKRSSSDDAEIRLPKTPRVVILRVLPEVESQPARYRMGLSRVDNDESIDEVAKIDGLTPDRKGYVPVYLNSAKLTAGRYQLMLAGDHGTSAENETSLFSIQVIDDAS